MDFAQYWFAASPAEYSIGNSLRFRGAQYLINTSLGVPNNDFTYSVWVKSAVSGRTGGLVGSNTGVNDGYAYASTGAIRSRTAAGWGTDLSDGLLRDPSAWYHLVFQSNSGTTTLFINGVQQSNTSVTFASTTTAIIGAGNSNVPDEPFLGYMADIYMIDGQALDPTAFGNYNNNGVWVPLEVDFTSANLSNNVTVSTGGFASGTNLVFDGNPDTGAVANTADAVVTFAPVNVPVNGDIVLRLGSDNVNATITWNGQSYNWTAGGGTFQTAFSGVTGTINGVTPLVITPAAGEVVVWNEIQVNGITLLDGGDYGANGWHLDFSDPDDIGADRSGNNNHFTPTGFDTAPVGVWSAGGDNTNAQNNWNLAFDGQINNTALGATSLTNTTMTWTGNIPANGKQVRVNYATGASMSGGQITINTTNVNPVKGKNSGEWVDLGVFTEDITFMSSSRGSVNNSGATTFCAIEVDGVILVDNTGTDYDHMEDSPTQNFATFNAVMPLEAALSDANLEFTAPTSDRCATTTFAFNTSDSFNWYVEFQHNLANRSALGVASVDSNFSTGSDVRGLTSSYVYDSNGPIWINGSEQSPTQTAWNLGSTISVRFNSSTRELIFANNGTDQTGVSTVLPADTDMVITCSDLTGAAGGSIFNFNAGQRPFIYTPPAGFKALQTQNMPAAPIANGRDHFDVITWSGDDVSPRAITGLGFEPDLIWTKRRTSPASHLLYDSVRGFGVDKHLHTDASTAEGSLLELNTDVAGYVSNNTSDGFVLTAGASNHDATNGSGNNYVAWCWKAGGAALPNTDGDIPSQVSANTDAGFSIVTYTGNNTVSQTVGHGLNQAPDLIILKNRTRTNATSWIVYSSAISPSGTIDSGSPLYPTLLLDSSAAGFLDTEDSVWDPTATTFRVRPSSSGAGNWCNNSDDFVAYCWHSVPGYSQIGSFQGNASADGPFVALSFRPAWIMFKASNQSSSWQIIDTTRDPANNDTSTVLQPNEPAEENINILDSVDILSNGFKIRDSGGFNGSGWNIVYAAFSENPYGGSDVSPANAR